MSYLMIKHIHITAVVVSFSLFVLRGFWMMLDPGQLRKTWVRVLPHIVDTVLLGSAIWMVWTIRLNPLEAPWLLAKIVALLFYIVLGTLALKRGETMGGRIVALLFALATFAYIAGTALYKEPGWVLRFI